MPKLWGPLAGSFALTLAAISGCTSFVTPHQVYAPLLDHAGQVDISVRGGPTVPGAVGASANVAYAPVDSLEIVAGGDFNFGTETRHYAGHVGIGTFAREDVLRLEATAGVYGGYAEGFGDGVVSGSTVFDRYRLDGPYAMPYGQVLIGFESGRIELAGGVRAYGFLSDVTITPSRTVSRDGYERFYVEPVLTIRIPFDIVRVDLMTAFPINVAGVSDNSPADLAPETYDVMWYFAVGVGFQIDTVEQAEPELEYTTPAPVYAPAPAPAPTYAPAPPPTYTPAPAPGGPLMTPVPPPSAPPPPESPPAAAPPPG